MNNQKFIFNVILRAQWILKFAVSFYSSAYLSCQLGVEESTTTCRSAPQVRMDGEKRRTERLLTTYLNWTVLPLNKLINVRMMMFTTTIKVMVYSKLHSVIFKETAIDLN